MMDIITAEVKVLVVTVQNNMSTGRFNFQNVHEPYTCRVLGAFKSQ